MALSIDELRELSNPGASGSLFFLSADDNFIIKTVQHKEATFLQQLLPGYYMVRFSLFFYLVFLILCIASLLYLIELPCIDSIL